MDSHPKKGVGEPNGTNQTGLNQTQTQKLVMKYLHLLDANKLRRAKEIRKG